MFQSLIDRPSEEKETIPQCALGYVSLDTPFGNSFRLSLKREPSNISLISHLIYSKCPADVARLIVAVVVDSIDRVCYRWSWPHIAEKTLKRLAPLWTHTYTSPAVICERFIVLIQTAIQHVSPCSIFNRERPSRSSDRATASKGTMPSESRRFYAVRRGIAFETSTRSRHVMGQGRGSNGPHLAATAKASAKRAPIDEYRLHDQSSKYRADSNLESWAHGSYVNSNY